MSESAIEDLARKVRRELDEAEAERSRYLAGLAEADTDGAARRHADAPAAEAESAAGIVDTAITVLTDRSQPDPRRLEVLDRLGASLIRRPEAVEALLVIVADQAESATLRVGALRVLAAASFQVARFRPHRAAFTAVLRALVTDPAAEVREMAVSLLAHEHDDVAQQALLDGLRGDGPLPVDRTQAIELLAEDDHLDNLPWLQELYRSDDEGDRETAVRHMGSYPAAQDDLETVLRNKDESAGVRQQSAASLRYLAPGRFEAVAKDVALDTDDDPQVRAACLQVLHQLGDTAGVYGDTEFVDRVAAVGRDDPAPEVAQVARELLDRRPGS